MTVALGIPCRELVAYFAIFLIAFSVRISLDGAKISPDGRTYLATAENILSNGCYSQSPPAQALCIPYWGPKPPGYSLFIAVVKSAISDHPTAIVIIQSLLFSLAIVYAVYSVALFFGSFAGSLLAGVALAISPLTAPYSHWVLSETLAAAASLWVLAECLRSLAIRRLRILPISLALLIAVFMRWDLVWLLVPVIIVAFSVLSFRKAALNLILVLSFLSVPIFLLVLRAAAAGLPLFPPGPSARLPPGVGAFWAVASINQTATRAILWPVVGRQYDAIERHFDEGSFSSRVDRDKLRRAVVALSEVPNGEPVPHRVDESFSSLAHGFTTKYPYYSRLVIPVERAFWIWAQPDLSHRPKYGSWSFCVSLYRWILLGLTFAGAIFFPRGAGPERAFFSGLVLFVLLRSLFLASLTSLESRYLVPFFPLLELASVMFLTRLGSGIARSAVAKRVLRF